MKFMAKLERFSSLHFHNMRVIQEMAETYNPFLLDHLGHNDIELYDFILNVDLLNDPG